MRIRNLSNAMILASLIGVSTSYAAIAANTQAKQPTANAQANQSTSPTSATEYATQQAAATQQPADINKVSYSIGYTMGSNLVEQFKQLNRDELTKGFQQGLSGSESAISKEDMQKLLISFQRQAMQQRYQDLQKLGETNKQEGEKFLAENKSKPGVTTTNSGLQYKVINKGTGPVPTDSDRVSVNYVGKLINGEVFSTSQELGDQPASFTLNGVIPAWREALKLMPKGSKWEVYAPASLAYGERGTHGKIGPNATLIFTIELVDVQKASQAPKTNATTSNPSKIGQNKS